MDNSAWKLAIRIALSESYGHLCDYNNLIKVLYHLKDDNVITQLDYIYDLNRYNMMINHINDDITFFEDWLFQINYHTTNLVVF